MYALRFIAYWPHWYRVGLISHFGNRQQMFEYVISYYRSISAGNIAVIYHDGPICRRNAFIGWPKQIYDFLSTVVIFYLTQRRSGPPSASDFVSSFLFLTPFTGLVKKGSCWCLSVQFYTRSRPFFRTGSHNPAPVGGGRGAWSPIEKLAPWSSDCMGRPITCPSCECPIGTVVFDATWRELIFFRRFDKPDLNFQKVYRPTHSQSSGHIHIQSEIITHIRTALGFIFQHPKKPAKYKNDSQTAKLHLISETSI